MRRPDTVKEDTSQTSEVEFDAKEGSDTKGRNRAYQAHERKE